LEQADTMAANNNPTTTLRIFAPYGLPKPATTKA
jgi:hypothetical protein